MTMLDQPPPDWKSLLLPRDRRPSVTLFPSIGVENPDGGWTLHLRGVAHRRVDLTLRWRVLLWSLVRAMQEPVCEGNQALFSERIEPFVGVPCKGLSAVVRIGPWEFPLPQPSSRRGYLAGQITLEAWQVDHLLAQSRPAASGALPRSGPTPLLDLTPEGTPEVVTSDKQTPVTEGVGARWLAVTLTDPLDGRTLGAGRMQVLTDSGFSVVSDIDDTIKVTGLKKRRVMLANTFLKRFVPIEGMVPLYSRLAEEGAAFHYVSSSPWQLLYPLLAFQDEFGYPEGSVHLRLFRLRDEMTRKIVFQPRQDKIATGRSLMRLFQHRQFVMIGDTADRDPEVYGRLAREFPDRIVGIWLRRHDVEGLPDKRRLKALRELAPAIIRVFDSPDELAGQPVFPEIDPA